MVEQSTLLSLIRFVGLITPAIAILIELIIRFHGGLDELRSSRNIPLEVQILFLGFGAILTGGMVVGIQMTLKLDNTITQLAAFAIFGGLPFLGLALIGMNIRISSIAEPDATLLESLASTIKYLMSFIAPLAISSIVYFSIVDLFQNQLTNYFDWWVFHETFEPIWYFYLIAGLLVYSSIYLLWNNEKIPSSDWSDIPRSLFIVTTTVLVFFLVLAMPLFVAFYGLVFFDFFPISPESGLTSVPFIWGIIVVLVIWFADFEIDD